jgi:hypothetical protein
MNRTLFIHLTRWEFNCVKSKIARKACVLPDESINIWLNNFTRIGYVKNHQDIETIRMLRDDSMRQLQIEVTNTRYKKLAYLSYLDKCKVSIFSVAYNV